VHGRRRHHPWDLYFGNPPQDYQIMREERSRFFFSFDVLDKMDVANNVVVYTGTGGAEVPDDEVCVVVDPSVTSIPDHAFFERKRLTEVELCEGIVKIGVESFPRCDHSITTIIIPNSLRRLTIVHFGILFDVPFVSTLALKALENTHLLPASSPTLESHPSSLQYPRACYGIVNQCFLSSFFKHSHIVTLCEMWPFLQMLSSMKMVKEV